MVIIFGFLAAAFALIVELSLSGLFAFSDSTPTASPFSFITGTPSLSLVLILIAAAIIEETSKYLLLLRYGVLILKGFSPSLQSSLLYGLLFGIGFSLPEAWLIINTTPDTFLLPIASVSFIHISTSLIFASTLFSPNKRGFSPALIIISAILLHMLYNLSALFLTSY